MARSLTNNFSISYCIETALNVASTVWKLLEPNDIGTFGAELETVARTPISKNRQRRKGVPIDLDSAVELECDVTLDHMVDFLEGYLFSDFVGPLEVRPTSCDTNSFTVPAMAGAIVQNTILWMRGALNAANNGLHIAGAGGTTTDVTVGSTLVAETFAATLNATLEVAGFRFTAGDLEVNSDGNLITTTKNFTQLGLTVGQFVHVGGDAPHRFFTAADFGYARVMAVSANLLTLDKKLTTFTVDDGTDTGAGGTNLTIDLLFGRYVRNVPVDHADYLERSFQFEGAYDNLQNPGPGAEYEYALGNYCNEMEFELPLTDKATVTFGFIGTDTESPVSSRKSGASAPRIPQMTDAFSTAIDVMRLRVAETDETGISTDFKEATLSINNNVSPEKVIGFLGGKYINNGIFEVNLEAQLLFTSSEVVSAIRENRTVSIDFALHNDDGAMLFDIPSLTLGDGSREFPLNETIAININGEAFEDDILGTSLSCSLFPYVPAE